VASSALTGIAGTSAGGTTNLLIDNSSVVHNTTGVSSTGKAVIYLRNSTVMGNDTGVTFTAPAQIVSYQNNFINSNITDGAPSSVHTPQD
jgi:hypothetical protein